MEKRTELGKNIKQAVCTETAKAQVKKKWQKPKLEDVSGKVMAQPYIRFT